MSRLLRGLVLCFYIVGLLLGGPTGKASAAVRESILYQDGNGKFYRVSPDGTQPMELLTGLGRTATFTRPSPDGSQLLSYTGLTGLYSSSTGGIGSVNIAPAGFNLGTPYTYSPDGSQVAFVGRAGAASFTSVYKMNANGSGVAPLVPASARHQSVFDWGAGGVLYKDWDSTQLSFPLWVVDPVSLARTRLVPANYTVLDARWSPDGSKIAVVASEKVGGVVQPYALYIKHSGGLFKMSLTPSVVPNSVSWAPTGDRVALSGYAAGDAGRYKIFDTALNLGSNTGTATVLRSSSTTGTTNAVWWGNLSDPLIPTSITTIDVSGQYSETVTLQATLLKSGGVGLAGAPVTFTLGGVAVGTATTNASGVASLPYAITNAPGSYTISAAYAGDPLYAPAATAPAGDKSLTVIKAVTTLTTGSLSLVAGDPLTLSGALKALGAGLPGKSVTISVNGTIVSSQTTNASGTVIYTYTPSLASGTYAIALSFAGDANYGSVTATATLTVTKAPVTLTAADQTIAYGAPVTLTATLVKMTGGAPVSGESVQFKVNGTVVGSGTTNASGVASYTYTPSLAGGTYPIAASYAGSGVYQSATANANLVVTRAPTTLVPVDQTITYGQPVTLTATLMTGATPVAGMAVSFKVGATTVGTGTTNASGVATYTYTPSLASGTYPIAASYAGDTFYNPATGTANLTVNKAATLIVVANATTNWGYPVSLTATLTTGGSALGGKLLSFKVNGTAVGTATTDLAGVATLTYTPTTVPPGAHTLTVDYAGDTFYLSASGTGTLTVTKAPTTLTAADLTLGYGQSGNLTATLTTGGSPVGGKAVQFKVNGVVVGTATTNAAGVASLPYSATLAAGTYTIDLDFAGDTNYLSSNTTAQLTVTKATTSLTTANVTITFGGAATLNATLTSGASPVAGKTITFKVNGTAVGSGVTNASGVASYSYTPALTSGTYTIDADWAGDGFYLGSSATATLTISKALTSLTAANVTVTYGASASLTATLVDGAAAPISGKTITFKVNGTAVGTATTDAAGVATLAWTANLAAGTHTLTVGFAGDGFYQASSGTATLTVNKAATALTATDVTVTYGQAVNLTATLMAGVTPVAGKTVSFKVGGTAVGTATTNAAGIATLSWTANLAAGTYPINADFSGDGFYLAASATAQATVAKANTALTATDVSATYGQTVSLSATLTSGATPMAGRAIDFKVNGVAVGSATTNASGVATVSWTANLSAGTYTINADYAGDGFSLAASATAQATITKAITTLATADVTAPFGSSVTLQATLKSGPTPVAGKIVTFKVNGTVVGSGTTDAAGVATATWTASLAAGTYPLIADFAGDPFYLASTDTKQVTVTKPATTLVADDQTIFVGQALTLSATLTQSVGGAPVAGKTVDFQVGATVVGSGVTNAAGVATYSYTPALAGGAYTITATFAADAFYLGATDTATLTVNKAATTLTGSDLTVTYGQSGSLTATLMAGATPVAGKTIGFKVNGTVVGTATTNASGVAALPWTANLAAGTYPIITDFAGDTFYLASSDTKQATVNKAATSLAAPNQTVTYGQSAPLTATLTSGGSPVAGKSIDFKVNGVAVGSATTNASGVASLTWTANLAAGAYTLDATFAGDGFHVGATVAATVTVNKAATVIATADLTVPYGSAVSLSATLTSGGSPVAGKTVTFKVGGTAVGTGTTNAAGSATLTWTASLAAGTYPLIADFAGDTFYLAATDSKQVTVTKPATSVGVTDVTAVAGSAITLSAALKELVGGALISGKAIDFKVNGTLVGTGTTNASGVATYSYTPALGAGTYTIDATFTADPFYLGSTGSGTLILTAAPATIVAADLSGAYNASVTLTATLTSGATPVAGKVVSFKVNGVAVGTATTNGSGLATLAWSINLAAGIYTIDAIWAGDAFVGPSTDSTHHLTVTKATTTLVVADQTVTYGGSVNLTATLTSGASPVAGRPIAFKVNGVAVGTATTNAAGIASLAYTATLAGGTYTITGDFAGDGFYLAATGNGALTINKGVTTITTADVTVAYGSAATLTATLKVGAAGLGSKTVDFKVNGTVVGSATTNGSGVATLSWTANLAAGTYPLVAGFAGDAFYLASSDTKQVTITKPATALLAGNQTITALSPVTLSATLTTGGAPLAGKPVDFKVDGVLVGTSTTNASGVATYTYTPSLASGAHTIDAIFVADAFYLGSTGTATLTINAIATTIALVDAYAQYGQAITLQATLTRTSDSSAVSGKVITFKVNGSTVGTATTNGSGVATLSWTNNLAAGTYTIDAIWAGDTAYAASSGTATLTADTSPTTLTATNATGSYAQPVNLTAALTSGATPVGGRVITFKIDGTAVGTATTNGSGVATLAYMVTDAAGTHTISVDWAGDAYYDPATDTATLTVNLAATAILAADQTASFGSTVALTATLTTGGSPLAGKSIDFKVNGTLVGSGTTDAAGVASFNWTASLPAGSYTINATFAGDSGYGSSTDDASLIITKPNTALVAANATVTAGLPVSLTATLTSGGAPVPGKSINFTVNGTNVGSATTNGSGVATFTYTPALPSGSYPIVATFLTDPFYNGSTGNGTLTVNTATTTLVTSNRTVTYGQTISLTATLTSGGSPVSGKAITFKVNGTTVGTATTNAVGVATIPSYTVTLASGNYPIVVDFASDGFYAAATDTKTLTVNKAATALVATDMTVQYGALVNLEAVLTSGGLPLTGKTVTFRNGAAVLGSGTTDIAGKAIFAYTIPFPAGTSKNLTADYAGDAFYSNATDTLSLTIVKADTTLTPAPGLVVDYNQVLNLVGTLTRTDSGTPINGEAIAFTVNGTALPGSVTTAGSGQATKAWTASLAPGTYPWSVSYAGTANYNAASGSTTLTVNKSARTLAVTSSVSPVQYSDKVDLTATLSPAQSGLTVTFKQGATVLGTGTTDVAGVATLTAYQIPWPAGSYTITADIAGDAFYNAATGVVGLTVNKETVTFAYTGDVSVEGSSYPFTLQALLTDGDGSVLDYGAGTVQVRWTITGAGFTTQLHTAAVDATGKAQKAIALQKRPYSILTEILVNGYIVEQTLAAVPVVAAGTGVGLWGTYYEDYDSKTYGSAFSGMVVSRLDPQVDFDWGASSPEPAIFGDPDTFSVRWTGYVEPLFSEPYELCVKANDGAKFLFGGTMVVNQWSTRATAAEWCWISGALTAGTKYPVTLEYFDQTGNAEAHLSWRTTTTTHQLKVPIQKSQLYPEVTATWKNGQGLTGRYYNSTPGGTHGDKGDGIPELIRNDANLYYSWDSAGISPLINPDEFYVEWKGTYTPASTHSKIWTYSDDGVRVWMRPQGCGCAWTSVVSNWVDHAPTWNQSANNPLGTPFVVGLTYEVWVEFYEHQGLAWIWLATNNNAASVIPQSQFRVELMPAIPVGLSGTAPTSDRVNLNWTPNPLTTPQVSGYVIFRSTTSGFTPDVTTLIGSSATTTFVDLNRDPGTTYYYRIAAIDTAGNISGFSAQISVTTP